MQVTGRVMFVNPPKAGQRYGSIKIDHPTIQRISMPGHDLAKFSQGQSYTIDVKQTEQGYFNFVEIVSAAKPQTSYVQQAQAAASAPAQRTGTSSDRMIFITGCVGRAMGSGAFKPDQIKLLAMYASDAYEAVSSPQKAPQAVQPHPTLISRPQNGRTETAGPRYDIPSVGELDDRPFDDDQNQPPF